MQKSNLQKNASVTRSVLFFSILVFVIVCATVKSVMVNVASVVKPSQ